MSAGSPSAGVGRTLAGGVQNVAAILPLIGTEQCEKHTGSALKGGYLYAAAAPLSIFGSLGIVKAGITILVSSISISVPRLSFSFRNIKLSVKYSRWLKRRGRRTLKAPSVKYSGWQKWLGGTMLKDAGFELTGDVAPLIGMDGGRFRAETRLIEMLEEKHIDDPEKITVEWKSRQWNIMLVVSTILGAALSITPYIALLLGPVSCQPNGIHLPWLFPTLRIVGSCTAVIACQFIVQFRIISLMKNRFLFMIIRQRLQATPEARTLVWDENLPAELCIWSLEQYLSSRSLSTQSIKNSIQQDSVPPPKGHSDHIFIPTSTYPKNHDDTFTIDKLRQLQQEYFPTPTRDAAFTTLLWILLGLSLPATVAGYIGCFTLVGATPTQGNGPLIWVGLEATLSILRIFIWASNPTFDEQTDIKLRLELLDRQPIFITDVYNPYTTNIATEERMPLTLVPEREFLERMTPFTGPLSHLQRPNNITLYFTLMSNHDTGQGANNVSATGNEQLLMTVFDLNMQLGVTFGLYRLQPPLPEADAFNYFDVIVKYDSVIRKFQAHVQSEMRHTQPWRLEDDNLFASLRKYYVYVLDAFEGRRDQLLRDHWAGAWNRYGYSNLTLRWDISTQAESNDGFRAKNPITKNSQSYLDGIYFEYQCKTQLIVNWTSWIVMSMDTIRSYARIDCYEVLEDETSNKARWELAELDTQVAWEWANRELVLLILSLELEDILRLRTETCADEIGRVRQDEQVMTWMRADFESGRQRRMEQEREAAKKRMERAMTDASERADKEGRQWKNDGFSPQWTQVVEFIDRQWSAGINNQREELTEAEDELKRLIQNQDEQQRQLDDQRYNVTDQLKRVWHENWRHQHKVEEDLMRGAIERICSLPADSTRNELDTAYKYPEPDQYATAKFASIAASSSQGKACSAMVYDAEDCDHWEAVRDVIAKVTTRSVIRVDPEIVASIPPNDHLLFLGSDGGKEPSFVQQNRDRWWGQQTGNASLFYFTPWSIWGGDGAVCWEDENTMARILVFLTTPSAVQVSVLHYKVGQARKLSIRENGQELEAISEIPSLAFRLSNFQSFMLQPGRHELSLVLDGTLLKDWRTKCYCLRDIFITLSDIPKVGFPFTKINQEAFAIIQDPEAGSSLAQDIVPTSQIPQSSDGESEPI